MINQITQRIKSASTWFIKKGKPGQVDEYSEKVEDLATSIPSLAKVLSESTPANLTDNLIDILGLRKAVELGMLVTGVGGTPLQLLNLYFNYLNEMPIDLRAVIKSNDIEFIVERSLQRFGNTNFRQITHKNIGIIEELILEDALFIICFAYTTEMLGYFYTWRKCNLASYCGQKESEILERLIMALVWCHSQIQGTENVNTGKLAEQKVRTVVDSIMEESEGWISILKKIPWKREDLETTTKSFDLAIKIDPLIWNSDTPRPNPEYIAIEVAWQETGNSVIHRKASGYQDLFQTANDLGHWYCVVVDGVGYFSRSKAMDTIVSSSHCAVGLSDSEIEILRKFITDKIRDYRNRVEQYRIKQEPF